MAAAGQMAEFFATFGFKIKEGDIKRIDKQLDYLETRARRMSEQSLSNIKVNISRFSFQEGFDGRLKRALKAKLKLASTGAAPVIKIDNFNVSKAALRAILLSETKLIQIKLDNFKVDNPSLTAALKLGFQSKALIPPLVIKDIKVNQVSVSRAIREAMLIAATGAAPVIKIDNFNVSKAALRAILLSETKLIQIKLDNFKVSTVSLRAALKAGFASKSLIPPLVVKDIRVNRVSISNSIREAILKSAKPILRIDDFLVDRTAIAAALREATRTLVLPKVTLPLDRFKVSRAALTKALRDAVLAQKVAVPLNSFRVNRPALTKAIREALLSPAVGKIALTIRVFKIKKAALLKSIRETLRALPITAIEINRFDVDREALLREMRAAIRYAESNLRFRIRSDILPPRGPAGGFGGHGGGGRFGAGLGAGAAAGSLGRGFIPGLGVAFGVSQLNKINQELVGQEYAAQAVFGSKEAGLEGLAFLKDFSNEVGQDYRQQGQPYIRMIASATNAGMNVGETQDMYTGISRYGRTMGLGTEDMKGSMRAVEQMLNKQQIYAEELKTQLAEKMPGVISAMAEAVTGDANNTKELFKLMEKGEVSAMKYLPEFSKILEARARIGGAYEDAIKASTAEQGRFNNVFSDMVRVFSDAGFEEGQAGLFRTMAKFLADTVPLVEAFGESWKYVEALIRVPLGLLSDLSGAIQRVSEDTGASKGNILALGGYLTLLAVPFTRTFTIIGTVLVALEDLSAFISGRGSVIGKFLEVFSETNPEAFAATMKDLREAFNSIKRATDAILVGWQEIFKLLGSDGFASAGVSLLRAVAREVGATADALLRVMKAFGYKDPNLSENDRLQGIQERGEKPKSTLEMTSDNIKGMLRNPLSMLGFQGQTLEGEADRLVDLSKPSSSFNPFLMTDEQVKQSNFLDSQVMRLGSGDGSGSRRQFSETTINSLNITGVPLGTSEDMIKDIEQKLPYLLYNEAARKYEGAPD